MRLKRFEKEARSASSLNHPNIVTIYDVGSEGGISYIAMERVEGTTLREHLVGGSMPVRKLLPIAAQIAAGLAKAHEAGIVHRDLKPENVMVTKDGLVKILDFGLARLANTGSGSGEGSQLPTETGTSPGSVVGTAGYMSPEQASGRSVDFRSDQFALGSVLYDMASGRRAFQKKTAVETLTAILNEEPEPIRFSSDGRFAFACRVEPPAVRVFSIEVATGHRRLLREFRAADGAGVLGAGFADMTPDARFWVHTYMRDLSDFYVMDGLR